MDAYSTSFLRQWMMAMDDYSTSSLRRWMMEEEDDDFFFLFDDDDEAEIATYNLLVESERSSRRRRSDAPPKIRPIDKKAEYQIQKLTSAADNATAREKAGNAEAKAKDEHSDEEDPMKYRPNPDMMDTKSGLDEQDTDGVYRPPKFMPRSMDDEEKGCKKDSRRDKAMARVAVANPYIKEIIHDVADRPEEWKETVGDESREFGRYMRQREEQEKQEVELFTRAPITKRDKQIEKRIRRQLHWLGGLTRDREDDGSSSKSHGKSGNQKKHLKSSKKRKRGISLEHTGKA